MKKLSQKIKALDGWVCFRAILFIAYSNQQKVFKISKRKASFFLLLQFARAELGIDTVRKSLKKLASCGHKNQ